MNISKQHFHELLRISYEQGFNNGYCDAGEGLENISCAADWLSEVVADGEIAGTVINLDKEETK